MAQTPIAAEIHQPLDVHRHLPPEIALDSEVAVDELADAQHLVVGQFMHPALRRNAELLADPVGRGAADAMDISEPDRDPLLAWNVDASYSRHLRFSLGVGSGQW